MLPREITCGSMRGAPCVCEVVVELYRSSDVLYNVMLQCKSSVPGKEFVQVVVAAPEPVAIKCRM